MLSKNSDDSSPSNFLLFFFLKSMSSFVRLTDHYNGYNVVRCDSTSDKKNVIF